MKLFHPRRLSPDQCGIAVNWLKPRKGTSWPKDIVVVAVDGSEASKNAVLWAANTATKRGIPLRIASSYTMPQFLYAEGMVPPKELYEDLQNETAARIEEARVIAHEAFPDLKIG